MFQHLKRLQVDFGSFQWKLHNVSLISCSSESKCHSLHDCISYVNFNCYNIINLHLFLASSREEASTRPGQIQCGTLAKYSMYLAFISNACRHSKCLQLLVHVFTCMQLTGFFFFHGCNFCKEIRQPSI